MIAKITKAATTSHSAYVEWIDSRGRWGRTEGRVCSRRDDAPGQRTDARTMP